jgi:hypothetical protein
MFWGMWFAGKSFGMGLVFDVATWLKEEIFGGVGAQPPRPITAKAVKAMSVCLIVRFIICLVL